MGQTKRRTEVYEVVIATEDCAPLASGHERKLCGDVIGLRPESAPQAGLVGAEERHRYLWLRMELTDEQAGAISQPLTEDPDADPPTYLDKRRHGIPLERLAQALPGFSPARARDPLDLYQPCCGLDADSPWPILTRMRPLSPEGLVWDKQWGRFW